MKNLIKAILTPFRPLLLSLTKLLNKAIRFIAAKTYRVQRFLEWSLKPNPEWFDHQIDIYHDWYQTGNPMSWERGIFNLLGIKEGSNVLELCCGDGFNAHHFYRIRANKITSVDFDPNAIKHANSTFRAENTNYRVADIRKDLPNGSFNNVIWDAAIEHFTLEEISDIMSEIQSRLEDGGVLSGYTMVERDDGPQHDDHEYEFKSKEDLEQLLAKFFPYYQVIETVYPVRHNLYFFASKDKLSFLEQFQIQQ